MNQRQRNPLRPPSWSSGCSVVRCDAFSGVTANPAAGLLRICWYAAARPSQISEVTEVRDAIHLLTPRAINEAVVNARWMKWPASTS
ncbi:UxaA family hydrolase [Salmonella enterica subsp. enterica]|nr:UxaA family hydrolase [Salmonella enterica subsp. enterica]